MRRPYVDCSMCGKRAKYISYEEHVKACSIACIESLSKKYNFYPSIGWGRVSLWMIIRTETFCRMLNSLARWMHKHKIHTQQIGMETAWLELWSYRIYRGEFPFKTIKRGIYA